MRIASMLCTSLLGALALPAFAQDGAENGQPAAAKEAATPQPEGGALDLTLRDQTEMDAFDLEHCEEEQDASRVSNTIVVCRQRSDADVSGFDKQEWEKDYAERTQGIKSVSVDGSGIKLPGEGSIVAITVTSKIGDPPPPALIIDVKALPEAPAGSDADRIARGLPPIGNNTGYEIPTELLSDKQETSPEESEAPEVAQ